MMAAIALAIVVRVVPILAAPAAIGDGGLFLAMTDDIRAADMRLPEVTSYNHFDIPFLYPPLALLGAAAIGEGAGASTMDVLRWMPFMLSLLGVGALAWVAHRLLSPLGAVAATAAYALMPHAYDWVIAGGGVTRGLGLLFALLACAAVADRRSSSIRLPILAGALLGLSAISHPQASIFGVLACLITSWSRPTMPWLRNGGAAALAAIAVVLPWLIWAVGTHGLDALAAAGYRLDPLTGLIQMLNLRFSGAPFMDVFAAFGLVGLIVSVLRGRLRLPLLLLATYLTNQGAGDFLAAVPWSLLAGAGVEALVSFVASVRPAEAPAARRASVVLSGSVILLMSLVASLGSYADRTSDLHAIDDAQISAMTWLAENSGPETTVLVPTDEAWLYDQISEWLPALADVHSVGTVQGSEWLGRERFDAQLAMNAAIVSCAGSTAGCYRDIAPSAVLFVPKGQLAGPYSPSDCCPALRATLADAGYDVIYDGPGATIARPGD